MNIGTFVDGSIHSKGLNGGMSTDEYSSTMEGEQVVEYEYLDAVLDENAAAAKDQVFMKQTLLASPSVLRIYPHVKVRTNKPFKGSSSSLANDQEYETIIPNEEDSQAEAFDENDDMFADSSAAAMESTTSPQAKEEPIFEDIKVLVRHNSICVDDFEFKLKSSVRSSCIVPASAAQEEDHILLSLTSGFLLLLRIFHVPLHLRDTDYASSRAEEEDNLVFKPFAIQWWNLSSSSPSLGLETSGFDLKSSPSGLSTISCSASNSFRLYMTLQQDSSGLVLKNHLNIALGGFLIDSCFIEPKSATQTEMYLTLVYTDERRLYVMLYSWSSFYGSSPEISKAIYPLMDTFPIPIFIIPLKTNGSFLFVSPAQGLLIVTIHDILSAQYSSRKATAPWKSFPTSFHIPQTKIVDLDLPSLDEVIIATDTGVLYSVLVSENEISSISPILRVPESISTFSLEKVTESWFSLSYASIGGGCRTVQIGSIYRKEYLCDVSDENKLSYSKCRVIETFDACAPIKDCALVEKSISKDSTLRPTQELWTLNGLRDRCRLTQLKSARYGQKRGNTYYDKLREVTSAWTLQFSGLEYILCSLPFESTLLEVTASDDETDSFVQIDSPLLCQGEPTIFACVCTCTHDFLETELLVQVTPHSIVLSDLVDLCISQEFEDAIVFAEFTENSLVVLLSSKVDGKKTHLCTYSFSGTRLEEISEFADLLALRHSFEIDYEPSMLKKCCDRAGNFHLAVGSFSGDLTFYKIDINGSSISAVHHLKLQKARRDICSFNVPYASDNTVANDLSFFQDKIYVGTRQGQLLVLEPTSTNSLEITRFLQIADDAAISFTAPIGDQLLFYTNLDLFVIDSRQGQYPEQVYMNESQNRSIATVVSLKSDFSTKWNRFSLFRSNGLVLAEIFTQKRPFLKHIKVDPDAKKVFYLPHLSIFLLLCDRKSNDRLACVDYKTCRVIPHCELNGKFEGGAVFAPDEIPICANVWEINRSGKKSYKVVVGCKKVTSGKARGSVKVLDLKKSKRRKLNDQDAYYEVAITGLTSFGHSHPVKHIQQWQDRLFFDGGDSIWSTCYDETEKRLTSPNLIQVFPSEIVSFSIRDDQALVTTKQDSVYQFKLGESDCVAIGVRPPFEPFCDQLNFKDKIVTSSKVSNKIAISKISRGVPALTPRGFIEQEFKFEIPGISRLFLAKLDNPWVDDHRISDHDDHELTVLCVTVSGSVIALRSVDQVSSELRGIRDSLNKNSAFKLTLQEQLQKLDRPFDGKKAGTGLFSPNKPYFECMRPECDVEAEVALCLQIVDLDLDEVSRAAFGKISL
ncbi:uncharacterized protein LODBEIA_P07780 [Lodderomyces beijingensis]|uniref:Cleavage/polyadenylation specificity factor A subunit N-terminal domain-containing protein n=1 Tax=Lodderomyces beijingensis TaxID=1775926 RepID=A0ABP0ZEF4_9ASCO